MIQFAHCRIAEEQPSLTINYSSVPGIRYFVAVGSLVAISLSQSSIVSGSNVHIHGCRMIALKNTVIICATSQALVYNTQNAIRKTSASLGNNALVLCLRLGDVHFECCYLVPWKSRRSCMTSCVMF